MTGHYLIVHGRGLCLEYQLTTVVKKYVIAILVGALLTLFLFALAGILGGACHCVVPTIVFFPFGSWTLVRFGAESISFLTMVLQFPIYAVVLVSANGRQRQKIVCLILTLLHVAAALAGLRVGS